MYLDRVKIYVQAGAGGDGKTSFRTEKFVPNGGPDGGDGGNGGSVIFVADKMLDDLVDFRFTKHFRAQNGANGEGSNKTGKSGADLIVKVPCGTVIKDAETEKIIADLFADGEKVVVLEGGLGGKGNARYKTSRRQAPAFSQTGQKTEEKTILLELKTIADVGLIGFPNVGKSTLLSMMTNAKPKIANYHFTTLAPNIGVCVAGSERFVIADIPGLIEGASEGVGLGHYFLRHVERTRLLLHVIDVAGSEGRDPYSDYKIVNTELKKYGKKVANLPQIIVLNKIDMATERQIKEFKAHISKLKNKPEIVEVSAISNKNLDTLIRVVMEKLKTLPPKQREDFEPFKYERPDANKYVIERADNASFIVSGGYIDELSRGIVLNDPTSFAYFQKAIKDKGIIRELKKRGMKTGDTVIIGDIEFTYED
ncbi:MAG: GTPase ObgE [Clostridia bacterium]|nr:GTPase ObgE [Clostridia bacterium]